MLQQEVIQLRKIVSEIKQISDAKAEACAVLLGALADAQEVLALPKTGQLVPSPDEAVRNAASGMIKAISRCRLS
jgi:hypothetical protein